MIWEIEAVRRLRSASPRLRVSATPCQSTQYSQKSQQLALLVTIWNTDCSAVYVIDSGPVTTYWASGATHHPSRPVLAATHRDGGHPAPARPPHRCGTKRTMTRRCGVLYHQ